MKKPTRAEQSHGAFQPFATANEPIPFYWNPIDYAAIGADLARVLFAKDEPPLTKREIQARVNNYWWRLAYPREPLWYAEAMRQARTGNDKILLKLIRLFGREIEEQPWCAERLKRARQEHDYHFYRLYEEARRSALPFSSKEHSRRRLFILAFFEPELRELKPKAIMRAFRGLLDAGKVPARVVPPSLNALRVYLHTRLGWTKNH
jgi:hypothetical protein